MGLARAAASFDLRLSLSFSLDHDHRLNSGPTLREAIYAVDAKAGEAQPDFYGINLRPNAVSMEKTKLCKLGHLESGNPDELGQQMGELAARYPHIDIWGGCCGTWEEHFDRIAYNVGQKH